MVEATLMGLNNTSLIMSLVPSDFSTDFINPLGLAKITKLARIPENTIKALPEVEKAGNFLSKLGVKQKGINIGSGVLDLSGKSHFDERLQKYIDTPHTHKFEFNFDGNKWHSK